MRIAIDARSLEGNKTGVGRYLENLLKVWKQRQECQFILYFKDEIPDKGILRSENFILKKIGNPLGFSSNFFFQHILLPCSLRQDKADFFFSPFYLRPFFCPVKSAIVLHDISYEAHPEWFDGRSQFILRTLSRLSARRADCIFTVSGYSKEEIIRHYGVSEGNIEVTPLAADADFGRKADDSRVVETKEKYGLGKFILAVGTIFNRRHIPEVIRSFEKFSHEDGGHQLLIVGKNKTFPVEDVDAMIKDANDRLGRTGIVRTDSVGEEELIALYSGCEAVIYLSDYEGFGLPVVEGQSFGKPVITSRNTSLIEVGGDSVEFVKDNTDIEEISSALRKILTDTDYARDLVRKGDENIRRFDWGRCADATLSCIKKCLNAK